MERGLLATISGLIPPAELPEIRRVIGEPLIERNESLRQEADALREIVEAYAEEHSSQKQAAPAALVTPERDLLERKILMLLEYLDQQNHNYSADDERVATYVKSGRSKSPASSFFVEDDAAPIVSPTRRALPTVSIETIDDIVGEVRQLFEAEAAELLDEIEALNRTFDTAEAAASKKPVDDPSDKAPTLSELRNFGAQLEDEWLRHEHRCDVRKVLAKAHNRDDGEESPTLRRRPPSTPSANASSPDEKSRLSRSAPFALEGGRPVAQTTTTLGKLQPPPGGRHKIPPSKSKLRARLRDARDQTLLNEW